MYLIFFRQNAIAYLIDSSGLDGKESACDAGDLGSIPGSGRFPREEMAIHSSILAWETPWKRNLEGYSLWGLKELDTTE